MVYDFSIYAASGVAYDTFIADGVRKEQRYPVEGKIMQSTGLLDKNGVEIFEGDVVNIEQWSSGPMAVVWDNGGFYLAERPISEWFSQVLSVVGNIYQGATPART